MTEINLKWIPLKHPPVDLCTQVSELSLALIHLSIFNRKELTADARELKGELYCLPCHDKMGVPICGACRRPIEGRVVNAMGKQWHVEVSIMDVFCLEK